MESDDALRRVLGSQIDELKSKVSLVADRIQVDIGRQLKDVGLQLAKAAAFIVESFPPATELRPVIEYLANNGWFVAYHPGRAVYPLQP